MSDNKTLNKAKREKYNEYYTRYEDIDSEIQAYLQMNPYLFKDKVIYCPCDDFEQSNFAKYFITNFDNFQLAKLICTGMSLTDDKGKYLVMTKNNTDSGYLKADGDFRSDEVKEYYKEADFIITNPPFSLFNDFILQMQEAGCDYLVIGSLSAISMMNIFPLWKNNSLRAGYTKPKKFLQPSGEYRNFGNCCWYTTLPTETSKEVLPEKEQDIGTYNRYWNCEAIDVPKLSEIPTGYDGLMGVPLTYIFHHNPDLYDVVGIDRFTDCVRPIGKEWCKLYRSQGGKAHLSEGMRVLVMIDKEGKAKSVFARIIIKKCSKHK